MGRKKEVSKRETVLRKVRFYVRRTFGGNFKRAFDAYDNAGGVKSGKIDQRELKLFLEDAGIGYMSGFYASRIVNGIDTDSDHEISWGEFECLLASD